MNAIEARKKAADFRVIYANGGSFTVIARDGIATIKGRGVRALGNPRTYEVTNAALAKLRASYAVEADF